jgi:hypothetical protein
MDPLGLGNCVILRSCLKVALDSLRVYPECPSDRPVRVPVLAQSGFRVSEGALIERGALLSCYPASCREENGGATMGVRVLSGETGGGTRAAAMYCSTTGWMIGPLWEGEDAAEQVEQFCRWLKLKGWIGALLVALRGRFAFQDGTDPRHWPDCDLERLVAYWRDRYVDDGGWLYDPRLCACGHPHDEDGCTASCKCPAWRPGNPAAEDAARLREEGRR